MSEAQHAGIATGAWDSDVTASAHHLFATRQATFQSIGYGLADSMAPATGAKGQFMALTGSLTTPNTNMWISFLRQGIKQKYLNMKIATVCRWRRTSSAVSTSPTTYLQANPHTTGVFGMVTTAIPAAAEAIQQLGLTGKVHAVGVGDANENRSYVLAGTTNALVIWNPADLGYAAVYAANADTPPNDHHRIVQSQATRHTQVRQAR